MRFKTFCLGVCVVWGLSTSLAQADLFKLKNGGEIAGELLNRNESPRKNFQIRTFDGGEITIAVSMLEQIVPQSAKEIEYEQVRPGFADTVEGHWKLAEWCREHALSRQRDLHLQRILELDSNHEPARKALGYTLYGSKWMTRDQWFESQGMVRDGGTWRLPQEIKLLEQKRGNELSAKNWRRDLNRLRNSLSARGARAAQALEAIEAIDDPAAVPALREAVADEDSRTLRITYLQVLKRIGTADAYAALVDCSINDRDEDTRLTSVDLLVGVAYPAGINQYVRTLRSDDNAKVNRAAYALGKLNASSAVPALIESLVTVHKERAPQQPGQQPGNINTSFGTGGTGFSAGGGNRVDIVRNNVSNQAVLNALVAITGQNYNFNIPAWRKWNASQSGIRSNQQFNFRRDS